MSLSLTSVLKRSVENKHSGKCPSWVRCHEPLRLEEGNGMFNYKKREALHSAIKQKCELAQRKPNSEFNLRFSKKKRIFLSSMALLSIDKLFFAF